MKLKVLSIALVISAFLGSNAFGETLAELTNQLAQLEKQKADITAKIVALKLSSPDLKKNKMILVEGGTFNMGSTEGQRNGKPVHSVTVDSFWMSQYEVTQAEWEAVMLNNPSYYKDANLPVEQVSWYDCVDYCNKRSIAEGLKPVYTIDKTKNDPNIKSSGDNLKWVVTMDRKANGYRLPTEAEWEYAAKGGKLSKGYQYAGSDNADEVGCYYDNSDETTHLVGEKKANELGMYDMSGNVWEWCWDWYDSYTPLAVSNPVGAMLGSYRVYRGGSWDSNSDRLRCAYRSYYLPYYRYNFVGFRLVRTTN